MTAGALLLVAAIATGVALASAYPAPRLWLAASVTGSAAALTAAIMVLVGGANWEWRPDFFIADEAVHLRLDSISAFFLALLAVLSAVVSVYSREYWTDKSHPRSAPSGRAWWSGLLSNMALVLLCSNGLHFLIAWEIFTVCAYLLITLDRQKREVRAAGWLYLAASHVAALCLFAFFASLAARTGTWDLGPLRDRAELAPLFWLALCGFGLKAGMFPLHVWLPSAHANAPGHVSAILSSITIKMGIYGLVRFTGWLPVPEEAGWVIASLGMASAVLGVAFALGQHDIKRLLAYHSTENIGIILIGLGFALIAAGRGSPSWGMLALAGGLLHVWNHGLFKALLFLAAGSVVHATGFREMSRLGGLWRLMPYTAGAFMLGAAAISGLPPLNGFVSEWLIYLGLFDSLAPGGTVAWIAVPAAVLLAMTGALALACFVKVGGVVFLGLPRSARAEHAHESGWLMRVPMFVLAALCVAIGLAPSWFWPAVARAAADWRSDPIILEAPASLVMLGRINLTLALIASLAVMALRWRVRRNGIARAVTWDCGYAAPAARMQYTAGSFAGIITGWFAWILRPIRHEHPARGVLPFYASLIEHTPETVLEKLIEPAGAVIMVVSHAVLRLQDGRVQAYIGYLVLGLVGLAILVFAGAPP